MIATRDQINYFLASLELSDEHDQDSLLHVLVNGFKGYANMSDEEIKYQLELLDLNDEWIMLPDGSFEIKDDGSLSGLMDSNWI